MRMGKRVTDRKDQKHAICDFVFFSIRFLIVWQLRGRLRKLEAWRNRWNSLDSYHWGHVMQSCRVASIPPSSCGMKRWIILNIQESGVKILVKKIEKGCSRAENAALLLPCIKSREITTGRNRLPRIGQSLERWFATPVTAIFHWILLGIFSRRFTNRHWDGRHRRHVPIDTVGDGAPSIKKNM